MQTICLGCQRPTASTPSGRCPTCRRANDRTRDRQPARRAQKAKYDQAHRQLRQLWAPVVAHGRTICPRCGQPINPAEPWDLGHQPDGTPSRPEHPTCNRGDHRP